MQRNIHQLAHIYCQLFKQQQSECLREMFCSRIEVREPVACRWSGCLGFNCVSLVEVLFSCFMVFAVQRSRNRKFALKRARLSEVKNIKFLMLENWFSKEKVHSVRRDYVAFGSTKIIH